MACARKRDRLFALLLCLNLIFIWGNSLMPGPVSSEVSRCVGELVEQIFQLPVNESEGGHGLLRKLAHFSEFACLGLLLCRQLTAAGRKGKDRAALTLLGGLATACIDETIQIFTAGRASSLIDVWIDTCGTMVGMMILILGYHFLNRIHGNKTMEEIL